MKVSVIVPALNEAESLAETLMSLAPHRTQGHEVIVVDGGSNDETVSIAELHADKVLQGDVGRAKQMNRGIEEAQGDILLFLHADTRLPADALANMINAVEDGYFWGRFNVQLSGKHFLFRLIERMMNMRSCLTGIATGDQAIFVSIESLDIIGAYPQIPLMEDILFSKRLRDLGWPACVSQKVITSSRRWEDRGIVRTVLLMWRLRLLFFLGVPPEKLAQKYG
ncbi:MAG: TIGR04283 family arsenosugar biosynthesis glycosyltransferase [Gammaproteobacteria bacterium]|nr:TIGR04283 family arsenosugar biosynthesis glycosyltransferase [Gammaproteobacteria bacterium]